MGWNISTARCGVVGYVSAGGGRWSRCFLPILTKAEHGALDRFDRRRIEHAHLVRRREKECGATGIFGNVRIEVDKEGVPGPQRVIDR